MQLLPGLEKRPKSADACVSALKYPAAKANVMRAIICKIHAVRDDYHAGMRKAIHANLHLHQQVEQGHL